MATKRLYRARNGQILGVCAGIAQWRDYPVDTIRLIFILIAIFTAVAPCLIIYFALGLLLPMNPYDDGEGTSREGRHGSKTYYYNPEPEDFVKSEKSGKDSQDYERMKKENDWDNRFSNS